MITSFMQQAEDMLGTACARITDRLSEKTSPVIHSLRRMFDEAIVKVSIAGFIILSIIFIVGQL